MIDDDYSRLSETKTMLTKVRVAVSSFENFLLLCVAIATFVGVFLLATHTNSSHIHDLISSFRGPQPASAQNSAVK